MSEQNPELRKQIEAFYLPKRLVEAMMELGQTPQASQESQVGIGFIDIADYTFLSKFLSPKENQTLLNGLYTAFQMVLERHGGYLNKIEGDSLMFQFDPVMDRRTRGLEGEELTQHIVRELFHTCVEMQRVCTLFNQANEGFLVKDASPEIRSALEGAFAIIQQLRTKSDVASSLNAFFQIRIRIGANIGEVTLGNFGPDGAKQWDVIGMPVIDAKRMETTSPVGGLRISERFYKKLEACGVAQEYFQRFRREAAALGSCYKNIKMEELFAYRRVTLAEKKGAAYWTYSVQVNPSLPEQIGSQIQSLMDHGEPGVDRILELIRYYRGNHFVLGVVEAYFRTRGVKIRKAEILGLLAPKRLKSLEAADRRKEKDLEALVHRDYSLFRLLHLMSRYQDLLKAEPAKPETVAFMNYGQFTTETKKTIFEAYRHHRQYLLKRSYFYEVLVPLVYRSLKASLLEAQAGLTGAILEDL